MPNSIPVTLPAYIKGDSLMIKYNGNDYPLGDAHLLHLEYIQSLPRDVVHQPGEFLVVFKERSARAVPYLELVNNRR